MPSRVGTTCLKLSQRSSTGCRSKLLGLLVDAGLLEGAVGELRNTRQYVGVPKHVHRCVSPQSAGTSVVVTKNQRTWRSRSSPGSASYYPSPDHS